MLGLLVLYGWIWSGLKKLLVREGRASRNDFVLKGLLPLWVALFALLCGPAFPWIGELGLVLLIVAIFFSRAAIAVGVRRAHDLGVSAEYLTSFRRQSLAYAQCFALLLFSTTFQTVNHGSAFGAVVIAGVFATAMTSVLLGGPKALAALTRTVGDMAPNTYGGATEGTLKALGLAAQAARKPAPHHPLQSKVRPAAETRPTPESPARARPVYKTKTDAQPKREPHPPAPSYPKPIVRKRKRGAIGEWT